MRAIDQVQTYEAVFFTGVGDLGKTINDSRYQKVNKFPLILEETANGIEILCFGKFLLLPWVAMKAIIGRMTPDAQTVQQPHPVKVSPISAPNS